VRTAVTSATRSLRSIEIMEMDGGIGTVNMTALEQGHRKLTLQRRCAGACHALRGAIADKKIEILLLVNMHGSAVPQEIARSSTLGGRAPHVSSSFGAVIPYSFHTPKKRSDAFEQTVGAHIEHRSGRRTSRSFGNRTRLKVELVEREIIYSRLFFSRRPWGRDLSPSNCWV
jgi:hypothetical protein